MENSYMDLGSTAKYLDISRNTLKKWIETYKLPVTTIDGVKRINRSSLDLWMIEREKSKQEA